MPLKTATAAAISGKRVWRAFVLPTSSCDVFSKGPAHSGTRKPQLFRFRFPFRFHSHLVHRPPRVG